jgi:hypothetical protein
MPDTPTTVAAHALAKAVDTLRAAEDDEAMLVKSGGIGPFSPLGRAIAARVIGAREAVIIAAKAWRGNSDAE